MQEVRYVWIQYITNEQGEPVGVLLDLETYRRLENMLTLEKECLVGLSQEELEALAESKLAPAAQEHLSKLLPRNAEN